MNELITRLSSILNLPKAFAITAPGLVGALAIALLAIPYGANPQSCLVTLLAGKQKDGSNLGGALAGDGMLPASCNIAVSQGSQKRNESMETRRSPVVMRLNQIRACLGDLDAWLVDRRARSAGFESQIAARQSDADTYQKQAQEYGKQANRELETEMTRRAESALRQVNSVKKQKQEIDQHIIVLTEERTRRTTERNELEGALRPKLPDASGDLKEDSDKVQTTFIDRAVASTTQTFLGIIVLAGVIGLLLQPLNRAFMTAALEPLVSVFNLFGGREVKQATKVRSSYLRLGMLEASVRTWKRVVKDAEAAGVTAGSPAGLILKRALEEAEGTTREVRSIAYLNPQYAVGKGLMSREELDDADQRFLTQADVSGGMVLPLIALAIVIDCRTNEHCVPRAGWVMPAFLLVLVAAATLTAVGYFVLEYRRRKYGNL